MDLDQYTPAGCGDSVEYTKALAMAGTADVDEVPYSDAWGKHAEYLTANHDFSDIFGESSPLAKLYALDGDVLLIGVGYDKNTSLHLADVRAEYPGKHTCVEHSAVMENSRRVWKAYETLYVDGEDFVQIGEAYEEANAVSKAKLGTAALRRMKQREVVDFAVEWIEAHRK